MLEELEPCFNCGCPGEDYDGHVCEDYLADDDECIPGCDPGDCNCS